MKIFMTPFKRLVVALAAGLMVAAGLFIFVRHEKKKISQHYTMSPVLRAKKYIGSGKMIAVDAVEEMQMPLAYVPPGALHHKADLMDAKGNARYKARIGLLKGEVVAKPQLFEMSSLVGLAWVLQPGETAFSLRLGASAAVAGLLQPGDWVNVLSIIGEEARLMFPRVRVAAVDDRMWDPMGDPFKNEISKAVANDGILITLILKPREALAAALASEKGNLHLMLASPLEAEPPPQDEIILKELKQGRRKNGV